MDRNVEMKASKSSCSINCDDSNIFPKVAIVILNYNGRRCLGKLLDESIKSALNQTYPNIEVVFADNGSDDESVEYITKTYGNRVNVVILGKNYGFCLGNNLAVKHVSSNTKYLLFLNPDAVLSNDYVEKLVSLMEYNESVGIAQGMEVLQDGSRRCIGGLVSVYGQSHLVEFEASHAKPTKPKTVRVLWAVGSAMIIRKKLFDKVGGFSPEFFMYYDELDLCCRILSYGFQTVGLPGAIYTHKLGGIAHANVQASSDKINHNLLYYFNRNRWLIVIRYFPRKLLLLSFVAFLAEFMNNIYKSLACKEKSLKRYRCSLYPKIFLYLIRHIRRELYIRNSYNLQKLIVDYVIPTPLIIRLKKEDIARFMTQSGFW